MENIVWRSEKRSLNDLIPAEYNPRQMTEKQAKDLSTSLERFNLADPIVINTDNKIIGGHQRINVLKQRGIQEVDVRVPSRQLTEHEEKELNIRLNKNLGEWDIDKLAGFDEELLLDIGFESDELDRIFQLDPDDKDDDVPEPPKEAVSKLGDIYLLGKHRVMCGDSTKIEDVEKLMDGNRSDLVVTDPPYNTGMKGKTEKAWLSHMFNDQIENWEEFLKQVFANYFVVTKGECAFYVFIDWRKVSDVKNSLEQLMDVKNVIVWDKEVHGLGSDYKFTYELCVVGKKGNPQISNRFGKDYQDIWRVKRHIGRNENHATVKPVELLEKPILHASKMDDIVLDLFLGSGSTLIACEKTNRICYGMEISPIYMDVIIKRWEEYTGQKATKVN